MRYYRSLILLVTLLSLSAYANDNLIPVTPINPNPVPASNVEKGVNNDKKSPVEKEYAKLFNNLQPLAKVQETFLEKVKKRWKPNQQFKIAPKDNILIPVGQGLMNTISTNFAMLTAKTNDETSSLEVDGGYLYVTVGTVEPISLVLYEEGVLDSQVLVTLVPVTSPPTIADIHVNMTKKMLIASSKHQKDMKMKEQMRANQKSISPSSKYQTRIIDILTPVAQGDLPPGFGLTQDIPKQMQHPCQMTVKHQTGQRLVGGREIIDVVLVTNDSNHSYAIKEEMCLTSGTLAVAILGKSILAPGQESEVYILRDKRAIEIKERKQRRPRLTGRN